MQVDSKCCHDEQHWVVVRFKSSTYSSGTSTLENYTLRKRVFRRNGRFLKNTLFLGRDKITGQRHGVKKCLKIRLREEISNKEIRRNKTEGNQNKEIRKSRMKEIWRDREQEKERN
jgi:hypothetical protein